MDGWSDPLTKTSMERSKLAGEEINQKCSSNISNHPSHPHPHIPYPQYMEQKPHFLQMLENNYFPRQSLLMLKTTLLSADPTHFLGVQIK